MKLHISEMDKYPMLLRPGTTYDQAASLLDQKVAELGNLRNSLPRIQSSSFSQLMPAAMFSYTDWTGIASQQMLAVFQDRSIVTRLRAEMYWLIIASAPSSPRTASMLQAEINELQAYLRDIAERMRAFVANAGTASRLILDTNDLLHYYRLDNIPWASLFSGKPRVALSSVVMDEIDSKSYDSGPTIRKRARGVYRMLEGLLKQIEDSGSCTLKDGTPFEILPDDPDRDRLRNNDDEIVARALTFKQASYPGIVTVVTRDIGMRARAMSYGLKVAKIPDKYLIKEDELSAANLETALKNISYTTEPQ